MIEKKDLLIKGVFIFLILCCFYLKPACALDVNGIISSDSRWTLADSPVNITGDVRVTADTTLRINPGVEVIFRSSPDPGQGYSLRIEGTLMARGNQKQSIVFTAEDPAVPWGAIIFSDTSNDWNPGASSGSVVEYCVIEYGGNDPDSEGMISTINAMPLIARNAIRFSPEAGISAIVSADPGVIDSLSGRIRIISNRIYSNATGIRFSAEGGIIEDNYFLNNTQAIDLEIRSNDLEIANNTVISTAPELFGTALQLVLDETASGITAYQWRQTAGPSVTLTNPQSARTAFTAPDPGNKIETLAFELTVTGQDGGKTANTVEVTVTGDNPPPVANAGRDQNVELPQAPGEEVTVTLSAEGSTDPYLGITDYKWKQTTGPSVNLAGANTIRPTFTIPSSISAGDRMTFLLTVTDQAGLSSTDEVNIIYFDDNVFPVAAAGRDRGVAQGGRINLDGTGSADPDGSIAAYEWTQTSGPPVELINPNTARPYFEAPSDNESAQTLTFQLKVTDNGGLENTDDISITVLGPLIADIQTNFSTGNRVILDGSASIYQNATANINIQSNLLEMDNQRAALIALTATENASFNLNLTGNNLKATEDTGYIVYTYDWPAQAPQTLALPNNWWGTGDAQIIEGLIYDQIDNYELPSIEFRPFANQSLGSTGSSLPYPPLANAGPDQESAADNAVTLDGTGSYDPEGIARYQWRQTDGLAVNLENADQATATFIAPSGGDDGKTLEFALTVSTDDTFSHSDTVSVTVTPDEALSTVDVDSCFIQSAVSQYTVSNDSGTSFLAFLSAFLLFTGLFMTGVIHLLRHKISGIFVLIAVLAFITPPASAGYFSVGGGGGGDADNANATIETGAKDIYLKGFDFLFGMGIHFIPHSDDELPDPTISAPCPNEACTSPDTVRKGTEVGLFGKLGVEIAKSDFYVSAIGGFTAFTESELSRSPATGRVYEESSDSQIEALYGGGVSYFFDFKYDIVLHVDYDNIRGVTGGIGLHW